MWNCKYTVLTSSDNWSKKDVDWEIGLDAEMGTTGLNLLKRMLDYDPTKRVTAGQALAHDYFKEPPLPINKYASNTIAAV